jgi:hypothetical protein
MLNKRHRRWLAMVIAAASAIYPGLPLQAETTLAGFTPASFNVSPSGAATYSIPIQMPPGIAGMVPSIAIAYSSQGGNGLLGTGWSLSGLSVIHRCGRTLAQDGNNRGVSYISSDRYCLDGQRLVGVSGTYGADGAEYRTERESYTRIISYSSAGSGPAYFKAWTKSGQIIEYGNTTDSRIEAQGKSDVRVYAASKISDTVGNFLTVTYTEDNTNGDYYPTRIDYTGNGGQSPINSVRFTYETRSDIAPMYIGGAKISTQKRMTNIKTHVGDIVIRDYRLSYDNSGPGSASRLLSVRECTDGGSSASCFTANSFTYPTASSGDSYSTSGSWSAAGGSGPAASLADINGDGLADQIYVSGTTIYYKLSNGSSFGSATSFGSDSSACAVADEEGCVSYEARFTIGDFNGDGKADVITGEGNVYLSTGSGFGSPSSWSVAFGARNAAAGDANGDGYSDLFYDNGSGTVYVAYSNGSNGFSSTASITSDGQVCINNTESGCEAWAIWIAVGDFNGDGLADVVTGGDGVSSTGKVFVANGSGFTDKGNWGITFGNLKHFARTADVNGDGFSDLIYGNGANVAIALSNGASFGFSQNVGSENSACLVHGEEDCETWTAQFAVGDINGDGLQDIITKNATVYVANVPVPNMVSQFSNALGATISPSYERISNSAVYTAESSATWPVRDLRSAAGLYVTASSAASNGIGSNTVTTSYLYTGGRVHMTGGGFLGFRKVRSSTPTGVSTTEMRTETTFRQDYPYQGLPTQVVRALSTGTTVSDVTNTWTDTLYSSNTTGKYHRVDLASTVDKSYELNGNLIVAVTTANGSIDDYGNIGTITVSTSTSTGGTPDGYSKVTTNNYGNDTTNWFLGRLRRSQVQSTIP